MQRYPIPQGDSVEPIVREIGKLRERARTAERPGGTQIQSTSASIPRFDAQKTFRNSFAIPGDVSVSVVELDLVVPEKFTKALITATTTVIGQNFTSATSYLHVYILVDGVSGGTGLGGRAVNGESTGASATGVFNLSDLTPGSTIHVQGYASVTSKDAPPTPAWGATVSNQASLSASVIYLQ